MTEKKLWKNCNRFSEKLFQKSLQLGLNGQKLARKSDVSDSEISRIMNGKSLPGLENAIALARAVGVSLDYLADDPAQIMQNAHTIANLVAAGSGLEVRSRFLHWFDSSYHGAIPVFTWMWACRTSSKDCASPSHALRHPQSAYHWPPLARDTCSTRSRSWPTPLCVGCGRERC